MQSGNATGNDWACRLLAAVSLPYPALHAGAEWPRISLNPSLMANGLASARDLAYAAGAMTGRQASYNFAGVTILVVDDNQYMLDLFKTILKAVGVGSVITARDGREGLAVLKETPVDIIFTDWQMEPMDGIAFVHAVRDLENSTSPYVPIVMVSGFTEAARVREARDAGVNEFLAKPVSPGTVVERLNAIILKPRPFISAKTFFGPDRRRRKDDYTGPERRPGKLMAEDEPQRHAPGSGSGE